MLQLRAQYITSDLGPLHGPHFASSACGHVQMFCSDMVRADFQVLRRTGDGITKSSTSKCLD